ncbi:MAG: TolC family protein [Rickettsiales bacterium]|nr:TolC family protein [Rickettsiales bacterium]
MHKYALLLLITLLNSCSKYQQDYPSSFYTPRTWHTKFQDSNVDTKNINYTKLWWEYFNDAKLKNIIKLAIDNNLDYKTALARLEYAQANNISKTSILYPQISAQQGVQSSKNNAFITRKTLRADNASLASNWEIDLFGTNHNLATASKHHLLSKTHHAQAVLISLVSEVINLYIEYKVTAQILDLTKKIEKIEQIKLSFLKDKLKQGIVNEMSVNDQNTIVLSTKIEIQDLASLLNSLEFKIESLCNQSPGALYKSLAGTTLPSFDQKVIINSPIKIITTRPDIVAAKYELLTATSVTKSSISKQFPSLNIQAAFGYQHTNLSHSEPIWSVTQNLVLPLLNFGKIKSEINMNKASEKEAFFNYQKTVYKALEDVESALSYYKNNLESYYDSKKILEAKKQNLVLIKDQYAAKTTDYTNVIDTEKELYYSEISNYKKSALATQSLVRLSKSIGHKVVQS